jgi:OmpA-OmpF porin, OOP family
MKSRIVTVSLGAACLCSSGIAIAQQTAPADTPSERTLLAQQTTPGSRTTTTDTGWRMPYERGFWGHAGLNVGRSRLHADCPPGPSCDERDTAWKAYVGGKFNNTVGAEIGYLDLGKFSRGGGDTKSHGVDIAILAGIPVATNSSVFLKAGTAYLRNHVSGTGLQTGKETGFGPRWGIGGQIGFTPQLALRLDADRYRAQLPGTKENVDTFTVGLQYSFR